MKSTTYLRPAVSLVMAFGAAIATIACGPYNPMIPNPTFFALSDVSKSMTEYEREENLLLWQSVTDSRIPLSDIEHVVYKASSEELLDKLYDSERSDDNLFYAYLRNSNDKEISDFLYTAKTIEEKRGKMQSPWYYPESRGYNEVEADLQSEIARCKDYSGTRLRDRYGLQIVRAYFASRQYTECIEYCDSVFSTIDDDNLMKRMAQRYEAGCWARLGETEHADSLFARVGDILSLSRPDRVEYMARHNPDAPQIMEYIRSDVSDTAFMQNCAVVATSVVNDKRVKNKGDWNFLMAFVNNRYNNNARLARRQIQQARHQHFSTDELAMLARAYKMKLDAQAGDLSSLLSDLKWIESITDVVNPEANDWVRRFQNIVYFDWVPILWENKDYSTAILLCAYADNFIESEQKQPIYDFVGVTEWQPLYSPAKSMTLQEIRNSVKYRNPIDYSSLSFQLMGSLTSSQLAAVYSKMQSATPLYTFLRRKVRTDSDYYYELIGTLALREENYDRAISYLSRVSQHYQRTMNIYGEYLARDPFMHNPRQWKTFYPTYPDAEPWHYEEAKSHGEIKQVPEMDAKLNFAKQMRTYARTMKRGKTADERGLARLMYAIGRRNSFEDCWALTQYWYGTSGNGLFLPYYPYIYDDLYEKKYAFLYDFDKMSGYEQTEAIYKKEIKAAKAMLTTDEARARAEYILGNLATIVKRYPTTQTAQFVKTSCDNWKLWI